MGYGEIKQLQDNFFPRYGYRFWVNGIPYTVKNFCSVMEHMYKQVEEEKEYTRQVECIQERITES